MESFVMVLGSLIGVFLIIVVLLQRGRGGGLAGAFGGMGGQSAFGTKAGDMFTRITIVVAAIWILLAIAAVRLAGPSTNPINALDKEFGTATPPKNVVTPGTIEAAPKADGDKAGAESKTAPAGNGAPATTPPPAAPASTTSTATEKAAPAATPPAATAPAVTPPAATTPAATTSAPTSTPAPSKTP